MNSEACPVYLTCRFHALFISFFPCKHSILFLALKTITRKHQAWHYSHISIIHCILKKVNLLPAANTWLWKYSNHLYKYAVTLTHLQIINLNNDDPSSFWRISPQTTHDKDIHASRIKCPAYAPQVFCTLLHAYMKSEQYTSKEWWYQTTILWPKVARKLAGNIRSKPRNSQRSGCKSMTEGPTNMLSVFITLLLVVQMPNKHYTSTYMMIITTWLPNVGWTCQESGNIRIFAKCDARNLRLHVAEKYGRCLYKGAEGVPNLVIHLANANHLLLQQLHDAIPLLAGQTLPDSRQKFRIFAWSEAWNQPTCGSKSMVGELTIMLRVFINLLCTYTMPNKHYNSKPISLRCHLMAKHYLKKWGKNRDLRQETCQQVGVKVCWRDLQSFWECLSPCYVPRQWK